MLSCTCVGADLGSVRVILPVIGSFVNLGSVIRFGFVRNFRAEEGLRRLSSSLNSSSVGYQTFPQFSISPSFMELPYVCLNESQCELLKCTWAHELPHPIIEKIIGAKLYDPTYLRVNLKYSTPSTQSLRGSIGISRPSMLRTGIILGHCSSVIAVFRRWWKKENKRGFLIPDSKEKFLRAIGIQSQIRDSVGSYQIIR